VFRLHLLNSFLSQAAYEQLTALAADASRPGLELRLASGFGGMEESRLVADLWEVSRGRMTLQAFVTKHGYHGFSEGDIARRSWREDPQALARLIASYRERSDDRSPAVIDRERREDRRRAVAELADGQRGRLAALRAGAVLGLAGRHIPLREVGKVCFLQAIDVGRYAARVLGEALAGRGALATSEDVYFLTFDELVADAPGDLRELVSERRAVHERYARVDIPQAWVGTPTPIEITTTRVDGDAIELSGLPIFPGVLEGRVAVISDPATAVFEPGDILVCEFTDPSWAMLMSLAGALIIDIGGPMSHGAIVARELGIPTVINTGDGTRRLRSGDRVTVDAGAGTVRLLDRTVTGQE
jgi:pyruvate,water dikinase